MSTDDERAARARQRAEEERKEREQGTEEDRRRAEGERALAKIRVDLHRGSCEPLYTWINPGTAFTVVLAAFFGAIALGAILPDALPSGFLDQAPFGSFLPWIGGALLFLGVSGVAVLVLAFVSRRANRAYQAELAWMRGLPFSIDGIDNNLLSTSSDRQMVLRIPYSGRKPDDATIMQWLTHVDPGGVVLTESDRVVIKARIAGEPEGDFPRVRARRMLFRDLVDGVLLPLHAQAPFTRVEIYD